MLQRFILIHHYKIKHMWLHFNINTVKTLLVFSTSRKYGNLHAVTHLFNYFENCNIHRKKVLNTKNVFNSPIECLLETTFILTNTLRVTSKIGTETCMYMFSRKMIVKIVNKTRMQGCHTGCEQVHGIHISCKSSNNEVGVMSSNRSEYLKWGRLKTYTHPNWKSLYAGQENIKWSQKCLKVHLTSHKNEWM